MLTTAGRAVRCVLSVVSIFATTTFAAEPNYVFPEKVPDVMVHGATGTGCTCTRWIKPDTAGVNLLSGELWLSAPPVAVDAGCAPTYYALSPDRAVVKLAARATATTASVLTAPLTQPYILGVRFHILNVGPLANEGPALNMIRWSVANARAIFQNQDVGLLLSVSDDIPRIYDANKVKDVIDLLPAVGVVASGTASTLLQKLKDLSFSRGELNVYVLDGNPSFDVRAFAVQSNSPDDRFIVVNWTSANTESFAHELGHLLSLDHVNVVDGGITYCYEYDVAHWDGKCDYKVTNLMWVENDAQRCTLTPPQVLRTTFNTSSVLNGTARQNPQPEPANRFQCPDSAISSTCPFLGALQ